MTSEEQLDAIMEFVRERRQLYADLASRSNKRGQEAAKLADESRELAYFDVMKAIERIRSGGTP